MAYSAATYKGDGSQSTFMIPFDYLQKDFVKVTINEVDKVYAQDYNVDGRELSFPTAPPSGSIIKIYRETPTDRMVKWNEGSVLTSSNMTTQQIQELHLIEESTYNLENSTRKYKDEAKSASDSAKESASQCATSVDTCTARVTEANQAKESASTSADTATTKATESANSATLAKKWAMSPVSPDGVVDTDSPTGYTQSAKIWAESAKRSSDKASASARQQQADWDVEDDSVTSYIKNKPVLGYYIDTKYGLTNDNFTEKFSDFLAKAVENDKIALLTQTYTVNDAITIRADKVMLDSINGKLIGSGSIDFRAVKELYCRNIRYSITMKFNYRGAEEYKQKDRKIWIENCDAFGGSVQENFGLYISTPEPANGYSARNQRDYTKYGIFLDNYSGYNALMIVNKSLDDTGATIKGGPDNSALGILDRVTGVASPAVLIDTTRNPFRVISPGAPQNDTIHQVAFDMGKTGNISIGCSTLEADSSFGGSYNIKIFSDFPTIAMKSGKYNVKALMFVDKYLGFTIDGATVLKISSSSVTSIRNGNNVQLRLEGRNGNAVGLLVDDDGNLRISKYATTSQDKDQPRLLYAGAVSSRPTLTHYAGDVGCMVFDKNLGKPIWWTGKNWVDATGTAV